jgi:hypothetical protein
MSREKEMLDTWAKEFASEILKKEEDPSYESILDRTLIVRKLSVIMEMSYGETSSVLDRKINEFKRKLKFQ